MWTDYWWVIGLMLVPIIFLILRKWAKTHAKLAALQWIAVAERILFIEGDTKITFVSQKAYSLLPPKVKLFISYATFNLLVHGLYDEVKSIIEDLHEKMKSQK